MKIYVKCSVCDIRLTVGEDIDQYLIARLGQDNMGRHIDALYHMPNDRTSVCLDFLTVMRVSIPGLGSSWLGLSSYKILATPSIGMMLEGTNNLWDSMCAGQATQGKVPNVDIRDLARQKLPLSILQAVENNGRVSFDEMGMKVQGQYEGCSTHTTSFDHNVEREFNNKARAKQMVKRGNPLANR